MATTDSLYDEYKGESIPSFDGNPANDGQCEQWYLMVRTKRDGYPAVSGNAIDRWNTKETDKYDYIPFASGIYPKKDDYVVWGSGVGSKYGHIDVAAQDGTASGFVGYDSNWNDIPTLRTIQHNYQYGILGYVRRKGAIVDANGKVTDAGARALLTLSTLMAQPGLEPDRQPTVQEVENLIGRSLVDAVNSLTSTSPWGGNWNKVKHYNEDVANATAQGTTHDSVIAYIGKNLA